MTREAELDDTLAVAEAFRAAFPPLVGYALSLGSPPEPDVLATLDATTIGIEFTEMVAQRALRSRESEHAAILALARRTYQSAGHPPVTVSVTWNTFYSSTKRERPAHAHLLAEFVASHIPPPDSYHAFDARNDDGAKPPSPLMERVSIGRFEGTLAPSAAWVGEYMWFAGRARAADVQEELDRKREKPLAYARTYSARWLVVWQHGVHPSSGFVVDRSAFRSSYSTSYDRAFVFEKLQREVYELSIARTLNSRGHD